MPTIASILAAYSGEPTGCSALRLAFFMGRKYDAHVTGVVWHGPSLIEDRHRAFLSRDLITMLERREAEAVAEIRADFEQRAAEAGAAGRSSFLDLESFSDFSLADAARGFDIVVMTRRAVEAGRELFAARPDVVALRSGRPVLVAPAEYDLSRLGDHALVAWDGKRAAARALADAMRILETKAQVTVLSVGDTDPEAGFSGPGVMGLLERHGVRATRMIRPRRAGVAETILAACDEVGAGLLVMGAYEHSKFSEDLLGGVTRTILNEARIPVLMSH
ncbi:MAG: universal stress protein [Rubrimonas sp.]